MGQSISQSLVIANYTIRDLMRSKVLYYIIVLIGMIQLLSLLSKELSYAVPANIVLDIGLGAASISSLLLAVLVGSRLVADEIEFKSVYMILSRPVSRISYLIGKIIGAMAIILTGVALIASTALVNFWILDGDISALLWWAVGLMIVETFIVLMLATLFSIITNNLITIMSTISIYLAGHLIHDSMLLSHIKGNYLLTMLFKGGGMILPNFSRLEILDYLLYQQNLPLEILLATLFYGIGYLLLLISIIFLLFRRQELV